MPFLYLCKWSCLELFTLPGLNVLFVSWWAPDWSDLTRWELMSGFRHMSRTGTLPLGMKLERGSRARKMSWACPSRVRDKNAVDWEEICPEINWTGLCWMGSLVFQGTRPCTDALKGWRYKEGSRCSRDGKPTESCVHRRKSGWTFESLPLVTKTTIPCAWDLAKGTWAEGMY